MRAGAVAELAPAARPDAGADNPFLAPILARWRASPDALFAVLHENAAEGPAWHPVSLDRAMRRAAAFAAFYRARGIGPGDTVMLILGPGLDAYAAFLGAMLAGAVPSFLPYPNVKQDAALYWKQHRIVFAHARPRLVLVYDALRDAMVECAEGSGAEVAALGEADMADAPGLPALPEAEAIGLLQHSSGTTGLKKGVALSYGSIAAPARRLCGGAGDRRRARPHRVLAAALSRHGADLELPAAGLARRADHRARPVRLGGGARALLRRRAGSRRHPCLAAEFRLPPPRPPGAAGAGRRRRTLEALISCSEPCKPEAFDAFLARFAAWGVRETVLQTCYAMAETVFAVSQSEVDAPVRRLAVSRAATSGFGPVRPPAAGEEGVVLLSNGPPVADCRVAILRDGGVRGRGRDRRDLRFRARSCSRAITATRPPRTPPCTRAGTRTGDIGFLNEGEVFVVGRVKDVIIVNGKNVFAHDVEAAVSLVEGVKPGRAVAFGHFSERVGSEQLVVVAERQGEAAGEAARPDAEVARRINHAVLAEIGDPLLGCADRGCRLAGEDHERQDQPLGKRGALCRAVPGVRAGASQPPRRTPISAQPGCGAAARTAMPAGRFAVASAARRTGREVTG